MRTVKLLACLACGDVRRLLRVTRRCRCRSCKGRQVSQQVVEVQGPCRVLGLQWEGFQDAMKEDLETSRVRYRWQVVPEGAEVKRMVEEGE